MKTFSYWEKQGPTPIFKNIDLERPEQRQLAGHLTVIGGSKAQFFTTANATATLSSLGVGKVTTILPDSLKTKLPAADNLVFAPSESSGGFAKSAIDILITATNNSDASILIGDFGKNSETAIAISELMKAGNKAVLITRDAIDLITPDVFQWIEKPNLTLLLTLPQLQKLLHAIYYPKIITLAMPTNQLIEVLHKLTLSYLGIFITYHNNQLIAAENGQVISSEISDTKYSPISIWSGELASKIATYQLWNSSQSFAASVSAFLK